MIGLFGAKHWVMPTLEVSEALASMIDKAYWVGCTLNPSPSYSMLATVVVFTQEFLPSFTTSSVVGLVSLHLKNSHRTFSRSKNCIVLVAL